MTVEVIHGDCIAEMVRLIERGMQVQSVVCDPPYHLTQNSRGGSVRTNDPTKPFGRHGLADKGFMGKVWDGGDVAIRPETWRLCLDLLPPGGVMLAFGGSRTYHRMACAIEDAGFELRDCIMFLYGTGFPKSRSLLKPAYEPIIMARRPGPLRELNIDACRIPVQDADYARNCSGDRGHADNRSRDMAFGMGCGSASESGRFPANVIHDGSDEVLEAFAAFGKLRARGNKTPKAHAKKPSAGLFLNSAEWWESGWHGDSGTADRFFYAAKASKADRAGSKHPCIKPLSLMRYLCRLVTPPGGTVLDPFAGSGTTLQAARDEGFHAIGIEREAEYIADIHRRLAAKPEADDAPLLRGLLDAAD